MKLMGIVDSGSTKSDWVFVNPKGEVVEKFETKGLNPVLLSDN